MRIVVKVGTSTLAYPTGRLNIRHAEELVKVLSDLKNEGHEVILVSSCAFARGRPQATPPSASASINWYTHAGPQPETQLAASIMPSATASSRPAGAIS